MEGSFKESRVQDQIVEAPAPSRHEFLPRDRVDFAEFIREDVPTYRGGHDTGHKSSYIAPNGYYSHNAAFAANNYNPTLEDIVTL